MSIIVECPDVASLVDCVKKSACKVSLVIWDCDGVLRIPQRKFMHLIDHETELQALLGDNIDSMWETHALIWKHEPSALVDESIRAVISDLQAMHIPSIVLTQLMTGGVGCVDDIVAWRRSDLDDLGYDFDRSLRHVCPKPLLLDVPPRDPDDPISAWSLRHNRHPIFDAGVIYASYANKGDVLQEFLRLTDLKVERIIFVDDKMRKITHIEAMCEDLGIDFHGIHFTQVRLEVAQDPTNMQKAKDAIGVYKRM